MDLRLSTLLVILCLASVVQWASAGCSGKINNHGFWKGTPRLLKTVKNGKLFEAGEGDDTMKVLHVWGTPYEMGYAHGKLVKEEIQDMIPAFLKHVEDEVEDLIHGKASWLPKEIVEFIAKHGLGGALDLTALVTKEFTSPYWFDEFKGLADASGLDYKDVLRMHMLPELIKAGCSMYTAFGAATDDGGVYQLRALDWDVEGPLQKYPQVVVYHPNDDNGHPFANVGWAGWVAAITGMSSTQMAISEKYGGSPPFGHDSRVGIPFNFLLRDIIQFDETLDDAISRMANAHRTCSIYVGVGDAKLGYGRVFQYSAAVLNIWSDKTQPDTHDHPRLDNIAYEGVNEDCFSERLRNNSGKINAEVTMRDITALTATGNLHLAVYDLNKQLMYVANAAAPGETGESQAYARQFVQFDLKTLFAEQPPATSA